MQVARILGTTWALISEAQVARRWEWEAWSRPASAGADASSRSERPRDPLEKVLGEIVPSSARVQDKRLGWRGVLTVVFGSRERLLSLVNSISMSCRKRSSAAVVEGGLSARLGCSSVSLSAACITASSPVCATMGPSWTGGVPPPVASSRSFTRLGSKPRGEVAPTGGMEAPEGTRLAGGVCGVAAIVTTGSSDGAVPVTVAFCDAWPAVWSVVVDSERAPGVAVVEATAAPPSAGTGSLVASAATGGVHGWLNMYCTIISVFDVRSVFIALITCSLINPISTRILTTWGLGAGERLGVILPSLPTAAESAIPPWTLEADIVEGVYPGWARRGPAGTGSPALRLCRSSHTTVYQSCCKSEGKDRVALSSNRGSMLRCRAENTWNSSSCAW